MRRPLVALLLVVLAVTLAPAPPTDAQSKTLVVTGYGGRWSEVMKRALVEPFEKKHGVLHDSSAYDLQKRGLPIDWVAPVEGQPILDQIVQVPRGSKNKELAWKFIDAYISPRGLVGG